jgi:hypothetical protein
MDFDFVKSALASAFAPVAPPKVKPGQPSFPGHAKSTTPSTTVLTNPSARVAQSHLNTARTEAKDALTIRKFAQTTPDLAAALFAYLRVAITQGYKVKAFDMDGEFNGDATRIAYELLNRWDMLPDYTVQGFSNTPSIQSVSEALGKELIIEGACAFSLRLNKQRQPELLAPVPVSSLVWYEDGQGLRPKQKVGGDQIDLDVANFFYTSLDQDLLNAYPTSPLLAAVQPVIADASFMDQLRNALSRTIMPRFQAVINLDKTLAVIPAEVKQDAEKLNSMLSGLKTGIETTVNALNPEDALVGYDNVEYSYVQGGTGEASSLITTVQELLNAKLSTGAKALPSILGHGSGSQNVASSETLMFLKSADGAIRVKLNELYSRALTLGVRLMGADVIVRFEYDPIDLRPSNELEAFRAQKQSRILEQLSFGLISDEEASIDLTGKMPPKGMAKLSGTMFTVNKPDPNANSFTNAPGGVKNTAGGQAIRSDAPTNTRGGNK